MCEAGCAKLTLKSQAHIVPLLIRASSSSVRRRPESRPKQRVRLWVSLCGRRTLRLLASSQISITLLIRSGSRNLPSSGLLPKEMVLAAYRFLEKSPVKMALFGCLFSAHRRRRSQTTQRRTQANSGKSRLNPITRSSPGTVITTPKARKNFVAQS